MKKGLIASFMVALMLITFLSAVVTANAVTVSKESTEIEKTGDTYELVVYVIDVDWWPSLYGVVPFAKIIVTHEDNPNFRKVGFSFLPYTGTVFEIPIQYEYPTLNAYKIRWKQIDVYWHTKKEADIIMSYTGEPKSFDNPFLERFPVLNLLLQKLRI